MKRLVLGVIGHVDHGKTALVRALTGIDTDRLPEEKRRGISIALGFAHCALGPDRAVDLIDMPGHERFVRTMVAGATGIDAVLLVIAANEGVKPQTVEHVEIAGLLGLKRAVIAVTKADLVTAAAAAAVGRQAAALLGRMGLTAPAAVLTAATTGVGLEALRQAMAAALQATPPAEDRGFPWLPIDRAFSLAGHGTIVTGTLRHGPLAVGDEIELVPGGLPLRVRGLQVHGTRCVSAGPGQRVAVNLRGVEPGQVPRGTALAARGLLPAATWLSLTVQAVAGAPPLRNAARLRLLLGTTEVEARLRLLDRDELAPGESGLAQLHCAAPVSVPARERCILRLASPPATVAGGRILEPDTTRLHRHDAAVLARLSALAGAAPQAILAGEVERAGPAGITLDRLARLAGLAPARAAAMLQGLPVVMGRSRTVIARASFDAVLERLPRLLAAQPAGLSRERLQARCPEASPAVLEEAVLRLVAAGTLRQAGGSVHLHRPAEAQARAQQETAMAARLAEMVRQAGLSGPDAAAVAPDPPRRRLVDRLVRDGTIVRAVDRVQKRELLFHRDAIAAARQHLAPLLAQPPGLLVAEAGAALGISRKYSVPLLEYLDAIQFTRRIQDRRVLARQD